jgi:hypothetical protein
MTGAKKPKRFLGTLRALIGIDKNLNTYKTAPDTYYRQVFLSKENYQGVEFLAKIARTSRVRVANELIKRGLSSLYGAILGEEIRDDIEKREHHDDLKLFIYRLRRYARSQGYDINKFIK